MRIRTKRGYDFGEVSSAMQKAIRRADTRLAGYWALLSGRMSGFDPEGFTIYNTETISLLKGLSIYVHASL